MPYSLGNPALNCCGGSLSTFGNMKRPVAASAAADAAEKAPHARPIQARRVSRGDVSSASRAVAGAAFAAVGAAFAAAPPCDTTVVVRPAKSGAAAAGGRGGAGRGGTGRGTAPVAAAAAAVAGASPAGTCPGCGVAAGLAPVGGALGSFASGVCSSAINL